MVHGIVLARTNRTDVDDVVQDVFVTALERLGDLREPGAFGGWLAAIARHRATDQRRRSSVMTRVHLADSNTQAMALFDAGYVIEAFNELQEAGRYWKQLSGAERILVGLTKPFDARAMIEKSLALRPNDASIEFALGLISRTPANEMHFKKARAAAQQDALLAENLARLQLQ